MTITVHLDDGQGLPLCGCRGRNDLLTSKSKVAVNCLTCLDILRRRAAGGGKGKKTPEQSEHRRAYDRDLYEMNQERIKKRQRDYYRNNREKELRRGRKNREKRRKNNG